MIPYARQWIDHDDIAAVIEVLESDWLTQGPAVTTFENHLRDACEAEHAVAFSSGTAALHACCAVAGLGPGSKVVTSPLTFAASASSARYVGAHPVLVDIDPETWNLDLAHVPTSADAVVAVHYAGLPADLSSLVSRPQWVIEDAAHALGAHTPDGPVGNCARSDLCAFSFHPVKTITTGEGGAVTTNSATLAAALRRFRHHGIVTQPDQGGWYYEIETIGYNYRLTDLQAALGSSQLAKLEAFVEIRNVLADRYRQLLTGSPVTLPPAADVGWRHAYHLFPVLVPDRRRVYDTLRNAGIGVQVHYVPLYRHPIFAGTGTAEEFPVTESVYEQLLSLPMYPHLTEADQDCVVETLLGSVDR